MGATFDPGQLKKVLLERDGHVDGGVDVFLVGMPNCGKTNGLARVAIANKSNYGDVIVWRGSQDCQWTYFNAYDEKMVFWMHEGLDFKLVDRKAEKYVPLEDHVWKIKTWKDPVKLVSRLDKRHINIIQTTPYTPINPAQHLEFCKQWNRIFHALNYRIWGAPVTLCFDELEDVVPEGQGKDFWNVELSLAGSIRSFRKNGISSFSAIHSVEEVHWRVSKKVRWKVYMQGANLPSKSKLKVNTSRLDPGWGFIEGPGGFEKFKFDFKAPETRLRAVISVLDS